jgi:putative transposase
MRYRRARAPGATYFFTVVTYRRRPILCDPDHVRLLRAAFRAVRRRHPFAIDALVLLPDHLHCLWTLPPGDPDYATRWMLIKSYGCGSLGTTLWGVMRPSAGDGRRSVVGDCA